MIFIRTYFAGFLQTPRLSDAMHFLFAHCPGFEESILEAVFTICFCKQI